MHKARSRWKQERGLTIIVVEGHNVCHMTLQERQERQEESDFCDWLYEYLNIAVVAECDEHDPNGIPNPFYKGEIDE